MEIHADDVGHPLVPYWNACVGTGRTNDGGMPADDRALALGRPEPLSGEDAAVLCFGAPRREVVQASPDGGLRVERPIEPGSVVLLEQR
ncbi:hypothetical protein [Streptosporangium sp. KLBMP 9127]|nr:hypothetical protein [Streptosporangium sp. KLBMP 9127]